jgi:hypothetical protein
MHLTTCVVKEYGEIVCLELPLLLCSFLQEGQALVNDYVPQSTVMY